MKTKEKLQDYKHALGILDNLKQHFRDGNLLLITLDLGSGETDYLRAITVSDAYGTKHALNLTWAIAKVFDYRLRDRAGRDYLAIGGGNFSKPDELARSLAAHYGMDRITYEII